MLGNAGYGSMNSRLGEGDIMMARWYHPQRHTTILVSLGWRALDNTFSATERAGMMRWNELVSKP